ncbi:hypothetical protein BDW59DRAFT_164921 [Aspergillus cavernicola]|uniref:Actin binding protein n=1 Tax=Aspergillus cavernicola TaxID=176166 RepID=A0ABR4HWL3_9EURO
MATLNLSANGPSISKSYQSVVDSSIADPARGSPTFAKWAIFSVSTPLVNAFQQDAGNKESVLKVQDTAEGELVNLLDEFSEGKIQFAFVKVTDVNTGLPKNVLVAWCGEGVPERTKGYFTSHLSAVSKFLHGYHVQITARSEADLTVEGIIQKVGDASGAKYTPGPERPAASGPKPPVSSKPVFTPLRTGGISASTTGMRMKSNDEDGWGPDAPPVTRTNLEKVQPAYKPTKVNIEELRSGKQPEPTASFSNSTLQHDDVVRGGYQPIGKVDIAAIRKQARESDDLKDDRPEPVKGSYEPVGKVDIAAIRAKAQRADEGPTTTKGSPAPFDNSPSPATNVDPVQSNRLTHLPKPKVSNRFGGSSTFTGTTPPLPGNSTPSTTPAPPVGSASRTFADKGGKTPAQLWAERKARERDQEPAAITAPANTTTPALQDQQSGGGEWKSSYSGKSWAPVQTTHTGKSAESSRSEVTGLTGADKPSPEPNTPQQSVGLTQGSPRGPPSVVEPVRSVPVSDRPVDNTEVEASREQEASRLPTQPQTSQPPRSPTPTLSERESSPIRVAIPVGRGLADNQEEQIQHLATENIESPQQGFPDDRDQVDGARDVGSVTAEATHSGSAGLGGIRALVQFDYEKAEDNETDLKEGEYVTEIEMVDKDWWLGLNVRGERGLFPSNYVELVEEDDHQSHAESDPQPVPHPATNAIVPEPMPEPVTNPTPTPGSHNEKPTAKALYDYEAAEDNELSFPEDAKITNIEFPDDDWWLGEYRGKTGLFPANYVQLDD